MKKFTVVLIFCSLLFSCNKNNNGNPDTEVKASACKSHFIFFPGSNRDGIEYSYANNIINIRHINAGFNCCPAGFHYNLKKTSDSLIISESEITPPACNCNCLYDLEYNLKDITSGTYIIRIVEPYVIPQDTLLEFKANISVNPSGKFYVGRIGYPWGS